MSEATIKTKTVTETKTVIEKLCEANGNSNPATKPELGKELAAQLLRSKKEKVLKSWYEKVLILYPLVRHHSKSSLYDALPIYLEEIALVFSPIHPNEVPSVETCKDHGEQRAHLAGFELRQVIEEYIVLRHSICEVLEADHVMSKETRDTLFNSISHGIVEAATEYAKIQDSFREQFIAVLTHDLRNPLSAASMSAQLIQKFSHDSERCFSLGERISTSLKRVDLMLHDLLDTFQIRAGKSLLVNAKSCDLCQITQGVLDEISTVHGKRFVLKAPDVLMGYFDSDSIVRALENLLSNAVKYGDRITPITVHLSEGENKTVQIAIHNKGNPLSALDQAKLFDPFHRSSSAKSGDKSGWGLGLTLVQGVAEAHGGTVSVESSPSTGTTFTITLKNDQKS